MTNEPARSKRNVWRTLTRVLVVGLLVLVFVGLFFPGSGPRKRGCQIASIYRMREIATALKAYERDKGKLPERMSQLFPTYVPETRIFYFRCRYGSTFTPDGADSQVKLVDLFSPYGFAALSDGAVVVFERVSMWSDHTIGYCLTRTNPNSGELLSGRLPQPDFERTYLHDFKP